MISLVQLEGQLYKPLMYCDGASHRHHRCSSAPHVSADVSTHSTSKAVDEGIARRRTARLWQSGSWHRWLPEQQNLAPHCLKFFKTDTAIICLFQVIFNFKAYKIFKSEPPNYIKEHYTKRHLPHKGTTINNPSTLLAFY